jgi:gliding motility-associated-like protein
MKRIFTLLFITFNYISFNLKAQVLINEYSCSNINTIADSFGEYEDWIELYNAGSSAVNLQGYYLSDNQNKPDKWVFPNVSINPGGRLMIFCSGRNTTVGSVVHTNFKLTQTKPERIIFSSPTLQELENILLVPTQKNHSRGRTTDGANTWSLFTTPTPGAANANAKQNYATKPILSVQAGFYSSAQTVSISSPDANVTIRYTLDGSEPTAASPVYSTPLNITSTTVVRAKAFSSNPDIPPSFTETNTYFINVTHSFAVISVCGTNLNLLFGGNQTVREGSVEYFDNNLVFRSEVTGTFDKHGNDSWAYPQRGVDFVARDQFGINYGILHKIFPTKNRQEFQRVILKAAANDNYPFENGGAHIRDAYVHHLSQTGKLHLDERSWAPVILYMNGQYWGVYDIREKVDDHDFTEHYNNQGEFDIQFLKTWGATWAEYGGPQAQTDWNSLRNFITSNNMAIQANFDHVDSLYNWKSLVDYFCINSYIVSKDWLNWNTAWWRGLNPNGDKKKWRYVLWDMDASFGHYINYTGIPDVSPNADPCNVDNLPNPGGQGHTQILNALMANPTFKQYYISRYIDLGNTVFSCTNMLNLLDSMIAVIAPEMPGQISKWGGSLAGWQNNVQQLRNFIQQRCNAISQGMNDCYQTTGPYVVKFNVSPPNSGTIKINSITPTNYVFTGNYYGGIQTLLRANPSPGYVFDKWFIANDTIQPSIFDSSAYVTFSQADSVVAIFKIIEEPQDSIPPPPDPDTTDTTDTTVVTPGGPGAGIFIPNAFSPNGDGNNDVLKLYGAQIQSIEFYVYNRWGQRVFESKELNKTWDGTYKGELLNAGVYPYLIKVVFLNGDTMEKRGNITLVR